MPPQRSLGNLHKPPAHKRFSSETTLAAFTASRLSLRKNDKKLYKAGDFIYCCKQARDT
jgi:hypothetical protein